MSTCAPSNLFIPLWKEKPLLLHACWIWRQNPAGNLQLLTWAGQLILATLEGSESENTPQDRFCPSSEAAVSFMTLLCFYFQTACAKLAADAGTCIALAFWCKFLIVGKKKRNGTKLKTEKNLIWTQRTLKIMYAVALHQLENSLLCSGMIITTLLNVTCNLLRP